MISLEPAWISDTTVSYTHLSAELLAEYLECNHVRRVLCPIEENAQFRPMRQALQKARVPVWPLKMKHGAAHQYRLTEEICIYSLCVRHMPQIFPKDLCSCLLVQADGKNAVSYTHLDR